MNKTNGSWGTASLSIFLAKLVSVLAMSRRKTGGLSVRPELACKAIAGLLLGLASPAALSQSPTVNGLFYGDGDNNRYFPYSTSENGSVLYSYLDVPNSTLYVALVVNQANTNDMVCSPNDNNAYTKSTGWPNHRSCKRASDSEFATFTLECAPGSPNAWTWQQALGCAQTAGSPPSNWRSNSTCGPSSPAAAWPPGVEANSSSSWVANVNTYQNAATPRGWNLYTFGTATDDWKSPFLASAPNDAKQVPGYPTYSASNYQWEWSMVYEWRVNLGLGGANCGNDPIFFITGLSHHSPAKNSDENDQFPPPSGNPEFSDWGDVPDSYGTTSASGGARHFITVNGPYLGVDLQAELDGTPTNDATGDGDEEDGVTFSIPSLNTLRASVDFVNNTGGMVTVCAWLDIPSGGSVDGSFDATDGQCQSTSLSSGTLTFDWSNLPDDQSYTTYARFRITSDTLTTSNATGTVSDGEVEDYRVTFDFTPTVATIGAVNLEVFAVEGFIDGLALSEMDTAELEELWNVWNPNAASSLAGADRSVLLNALMDYLDPDGDGQVAVLRWDTLEERGTIGFYVERSDGLGAWSRINGDLLPGMINAPMGAEYQLADRTAHSGETYQYRLIEQEAAGTTRTYGPYFVEMP